MKFPTVRVFFTIMALIAVYSANFVYSTYEGPIEGSAAVAQLEDSDVEYGAARRVVNDFIPQVFNLSLLAFLTILWGSWLVSNRKLITGGNSMKSLLVAFLSLSLLAGCKPYMQEKFVDIGPNETAFVVPLEGASLDNQGRFESVEFLEERKVAAKRISIPRRYRSTGRAWWSAEIIDTVRVVTVDRSPVSRRWTATNLLESKGNPTSECIWVESQDSIGFGVGVMITAAVREEDTAKYLYNFPNGKPLSTIIDNEVKAQVQKVLAREFGKRELKSCKTDKGEVFELASEEVTQFFDETYGITVTTLGHSGGLTYENPEIQKAINDTYVAEMSIERKENEAAAQSHENARLLSIEVNNRERAEEFNKALEAQTAKIQLEIERMRAEADLKRAERWDGKLPTNILPEGSPLLYGLRGSN